MNKSIVFTIKTAYSREKYFLELEENTEKPWDIKDQIETALISKMCFCDAYDLVRYKEVDEKYIAKREKIWIPISVGENRRWQDVENQISR